ncbi:GNAT family N-acetyltransferase [Actibacterium sp. MT2.3-13A]|uniref:GNAT family N-acetyltransferase n=1 Tax=Actibacterium sp. MT2.3-13A TaxID=2828332 RepID=UPI001BA6E903|nr:GNAT family N-acetyltransferase [Actibacterium sp. MT2.3-13A]
MTPEALAALHAGAFTTPRPWRAGEFETLLASPGVFVLGDAAGFVLGRVIADEAELLTIAVAPEARRQGKGRALVARFETEARARGAEDAFLEVAADNAPARALYHAAGYALAGRRKGYYHAPDGARIDALVLRKAL